MIGSHAKADVKRFVAELRRECLSHRAVERNPFLEWAATTRLPRRDWRTFGLQLYPHCHMFIAYMEHLLIHARDPASKLVVAKILLDEYGEDARGEDHPAMFQRFLCAAGATPDDIFETPLEADAIGLVRRHLELCVRAPFRVGLGAIGPGHELTIPKMFPKLCEGMRLAGFTEEEIAFFVLHSEHDVAHAEMLEGSIFDVAGTMEGQAEVRRGAMASLDARARFWAAVHRRMLNGPTVRAGDALRVKLSRAVARLSSVVPSWAGPSAQLARQRTATTLGDVIGDRELGATPIVHA
jgi:pyrroloquinoline quinone (PQQ) biosynthesis protein C